MATLKDMLEVTLLLHPTDTKQIDELIENRSPREFDEINALEYAARRNNLFCMQRLLDVGCDPNAHSGTTALRTAIGGGRLELVKLLLAHGADPNVPGMRLLFAAIRNSLGNGLAITKLLVEHGIEVNETFATWGGAQSSPLDWAAPCPEIAEYLKTNGAKTAVEILGADYTPAMPPPPDEPVARFLSELYGSVDPNSIAEIVPEEPEIDIEIIRPNSKQAALHCSLRG